MKTFFQFLAIALLFSSCIGDDIILDEVPEAIRILNPLDTLGVGETYQFEAMYTNNVGLEENRSIDWMSSDENILSISSEGLATAIAKGPVTVTAIAETPDLTIVDLSLDLIVDEETVVSSELKNGELATTSSYNLKGSFTVAETDGKLMITFADDYEASTALPGLYVYLGNNPSTITNAIEIQAVQVFDGSHSYEIEGIGINDYQYLLYWCKPFNVKVGEGTFE